MRAKLSPLLSIPFFLTNISFKSVKMRKKNDQLKILKNRTGEVWFRGLKYGQAKLFGFYFLFSTGHLENILTALAKIHNFRKGNSVIENRLLPYFFDLRYRKAARPKRPVPRSKNVPGSGMGSGCPE